MKLHQSLLIQRGPDVWVTRTLCGRESGQSNDGMNIAENSADVTCKFCLKMRQKRPIRRTLLGHTYFDGRVVPIKP